VPPLVLDKSPIRRINRRRAAGIWFGLRVGVCQQSSSSAWMARTRSETRRTAVPPYNKVAGVVVTGNDERCHSGVRRHLFNMTHPGVHGPLTAPTRTRSSSGGRALATSTLPGSHPYNESQPPVDRWAHNLVAPWPVP